jgi:hypothetical protein
MKTIILSLLSFAISYNSFAQDDQRLASKTDTVDCKYVTRIIETKGKSDTLFQNECTPRNAKIFVEGKNYVYQSKIYRDPSNILHTSKIKVNGSNQRFKDAIKAQMGVTFNYENTTKDDLFLKSLTWDNNISNWKDSVTTGVIENIEKVRMQPFRENLFMSTKTTGYPEIRFPIEINNEYTTSLRIQTNDKGSKKVENNYKVLSSKKYVLNGNPILCWEVQVTSKLEGSKQENKMTFLFNENYGFVKMNYSFANGVYIDFDMIEVVLE